MRRRIAVKLRGKSGESIIETLVALLISSLALLMLAGAFTTATHVVERAQEAMMEYYAEDAKFVSRDKDSRKASNLIVTIKQTDGSIEQKYNNVSWFLNDKLKGIPVVQYVHERAVGSGSW